MKIFISWSGQRSLSIAKVLKEYMSVVIGDAETWLSSNDIKSGQRWSKEVSRELESTNFGILCITQENVNSSWICFEAGALSKSIDESRVCPYVIDTDFANLPQPISQFQATRAEKESTLKMFIDINEANSSSNYENAEIEKRFELIWPRISEAIQKLKDSPNETNDTEPPITDRILQYTHDNNIQLDNVLDLLESLFEQVDEINYRSRSNKDQNQTSFFDAKNTNIDVEKVNDKTTIGKRHMTLDISGIKGSRKDGKIVVNFNNLETLLENIIFLLSPMGYNSNNYESEWILEAPSSGLMLGTSQLERLKELPISQSLGLMGLSKGAKILKMKPLR